MCHTCLAIVCGWRMRMLFSCTVRCVADVPVISCSPHCVLGLRCHHRNPVVIPLHPVVAMPTGHCPQRQRCACGICCSAHLLSSSTSPISVPRTASPPTTPPPAVGAQAPILLTLHRSRKKQSALGRAVQAVAVGTTRNPVRPTSWTAKVRDGSRSAF